MATLFRIGLRRAGQQWMFDKELYQRKSKSPLLGDRQWTSLHVWLISGSLGYKLALALLFLIPLIMISVGIYYKDACPLEEHIPIYLIVAGSFMLAQLFIEGCSRVNESADQLFNYLSGLVDILIFVWLLVGAYWVFSVFPPDFKHNSTCPVHKCSFFLYYFTFVVIIATYAMYALLFTCGIWLAVMNANY